MSYEACVASEVCVIRGIATAKIGEHAETVQIDLADGRCINVSLPREKWEQLDRSGPTEMTVVGTVYREPLAEGSEEKVLQINGRTIGYGLCGYFFLYVRQ
jgi:hypothetical protein